MRLNYKNLRSSMRAKTKREVKKILQSMSRRKLSRSFLTSTKAEADHRKGDVNPGLATEVSKMVAELVPAQRRAQGLEFQEPPNPDLGPAPPKSQAVPKRDKHGQKSQFLKLLLLTSKMPKTTPTYQAHSDKKTVTLLSDTRVILSTTLTSSEGMTSLQDKRYLANITKVAHHSKTFLLSRRKSSLTTTRITIAAKSPSIRFLPTNR